MKSRLHTSLLLASAGTLAASTASAQIIGDDFETDSSANYLVVDDSTPNGTQDFQFDYVAAGIPLAPRSNPGDTKGVKLTANDTGSAPDATTLFHVMPINELIYTVSVDVFNSYPTAPGSSGTTEHAHVGVGGDGATFNQLFTPISGTGAYIAFTGDGGSGSDYRWFRDAANTPLGDTQNTTLPNDHPSYLGNGSNGTGAFYQSLFPSPPSTAAGSPGNIWTTVTIVVDNGLGQISFFFDGTLTFQGEFDGLFTGLVSLGIADVFSSISGPENFVLYDNLEVTAPATTIGMNYCSAVPNSTGSIGTMSGSGSNVAAVNNVTLTASQLPLNQFGIFVVSRNQGFVPSPPGSNGNLCLGGVIGRYQGASQIQSSGPAGEISLTINVTTIPLGGGIASAMAGDQFNFQAWHRDNVGFGSNFTDGLQIDFQ